jgi:hypothetical protein
MEGKDIASTKWLRVVYASRTVNGEEITGVRTENSTALPPCNI